MALHGGEPRDELSPELQDVRPMASIANLLPKLMARAVDLMDEASYQAVVAQAAAWGRGEAELASLSNERVGRAVGVALLRAKALGDDVAYALLDDVLEARAEAAGAVRGATGPVYPAEVVDPTVNLDLRRYRDDDPPSMGSRRAPASVKYDPGF